MCTTLTGWVVAHGSLVAHLFWIIEGEGTQIYKTQIYNRQGYRMWRDTHLDYANLSYLPNPSAWAGYDTRSIFKQSLTGVASPRLKNPVCSTIHLWAGGRIIGFILFPRVLVLCEMQLALSRIWTRVAMSIS